MAQFKINEPVPGIDENTKGGTLDGDVFTTEDRPWIKHLRQLDQVEEIVDEPEDPE